MLIGTDIVQNEHAHFRTSKKEFNIEKNRKNSKLQ